MPFDFPLNPTEGQTYQPSGGPSYIYYAPSWQIYDSGGGPSGIEEAPNDGFQYGRQSLAWTKVTATAGFPEAPTDGQDYARNMSAWVALTWTTLDGKPATFPPSAHGHPISEITGLQTALDGKAALVHTHLWADITDKPLTFPPSNHVHVIADVTGLQAALNGKEPTIAAGGIGYYWRGDKTWQVFDKAAIGLGNVDNTSDANKPISSATQTALNTKEDKANKGVANGYAPLDATTKIAATYLPAYVDDVQEFANLAAFPGTGSVGIIYVALDTNKVYRWSGTVYVEISPSPGSTDAVPEGSINLYHTTARAAAAAPVQTVQGRTGAVVISKTDVGLGNVDNTSDLSKPVSTATQNALNLKQDLDATLTALAGLNATAGLVEQTSVDAFTKRSIGVASATSVLTRADGDGRYAPIVHTHVWTDITDRPATLPPSAHVHPQSDITNLVTDLGLKAPLASPTFTGTPAAPTATAGTNTTQLATTAFVTAGLALKANATHTHAIADVTGLQSALDAKAPTVHTHDWTTGITGKPSTFPPSTHSHVIADVTGLQALLDAGAFALISDAPPSGPVQGRLWWDSNHGALFIYYNDGNTTQWVQIGLIVGA